jgi:hypothetical protein
VSREVLHAVAAGGSVPGGAPLDAAAIAAVHDHLDDCAACASQMLEVVRQGAVLAAGSDQSATWDVGDAGASGGLDAAALPPGTTLGRFEVRQVLGSGNMGTVFSGWDPQLRRAVAIKVLRAGRTDAQHARRLLREARAMAQVRHPSVVTVFEVGEDNDVIFIAMEQISGRTLRAAMADRPSADGGGGVAAADRRRPGRGASRRAGPPRRQAGQHLRRGRAGACRAW